MRTKKTARTKAERLRDRTIMAEEYLKGRNQFQISEVIGISRSQVSEDLKKVRQEWLDSRIRDFDQAKAKELTKLDKLESEAWDAWDDSKLDKETITKETFGKSENMKEVIKKEGQTGNHHYLNVVQNCIKKRSELLGFDEIEKDKKTDPIEPKEIIYIVKEAVTPIKVTRGNS